MKPWIPSLTVEDDRFRRLLPPSSFLLPTSYFLLPTAYFLLPTAYCLLPTAYFLLIFTLASAPKQPGMAWGFTTDTSTALALG